MALAIMFALQIFGTSLYSGFFDILWSVKFFIFFALIIGLWFPASSVFNLDGYAWLARVLGFFFVILEQVLSLHFHFDVNNWIIKFGYQVLLLDLAYSWNEKWLEYANADEDAECLWKTRLLAISSLFFACSVSAQGKIYISFTRPPLLGFSFCQYRCNALAVFGLHGQPCDNDSHHHSLFHRHHHSNLYQRCWLRIDLSNSGRLLNICVLFCCHFESECFV